MHCQCSYGHYMLRASAEKGFAELWFPESTLLLLLEQFMRTYKTILLCLQFKQHLNLNQVSTPAKAQGWCLKISVFSCHLVWITWRE